MNGTRARRCRGSEEMVAHSKMWESDVRAVSGSGGNWLGSRVSNQGILILSNKWQKVSKGFELIKAEFKL